MSSLHTTCPRCGGPLDRDEADVGVGVIYGPAGCPACFWTENDVSNNPLADMKDDADFNHQEAELQLARGSFKLAEEENERLRKEVADLRAAVDVPTAANRLADLFFPGPMRDLILAIGRGEPVRAPAPDVIDAVGKLAHAYGIAWPDADANTALEVIAAVTGRASRATELLEANNRYLEDARAARRELRDAKAINALITRQLITLREALEFYADEAHYDEEGVVGTFSTQHDPTSVGSGPETETQQDRGAIAEQALQDVFGYQRPVDPPDPYQHNPGAAPMPHPGAK